MNEITKTQRRTQAYWFVDGLAEMIGGVALAAVGVLLYLSVVADNQGLATMALFVMILGFPLSAKAVRWAKDGLTHQRTGYVSYPQPSGKRRATSAVVAGVLGVVFAASAITLGDPTFDGTLGTYMLLGLGVAVSVSLAVRAGRMGMPRFYLSAAAVAAAAAWGLAQGCGFIAGMGAVWMALGAASLITGLTALGRYLRATSGLPGEAE
ncbi:hypothetical protein [Anaerosoma tenue]|uniref:hypothetical protein n=1 Tax=Anaerosoma tenue TaxID=2933588 RepID=UPI002260E6B3|nr:hypothetical protein [Anaerosoma tenue]MCK8115363.1 hypothetical protein [Anaerosoma tenue]